MRRIIAVLALALAAGAAVAKPQATQQVWTCEDVDGNRAFQDHPCAYYDKTVDAPPEKKAAPKLDSDPGKLLAFVPRTWTDALRNHWPMLVAGIVLLFALHQVWLLIARSAAEARERRHEARQAREKKRVERIPWNGR